MVYWIILDHSGLSTIVILTLLFSLFSIIIVLDHMSHLLRNNMSSIIVIKKKHCYFYGLSQYYPSIFHISSEKNKDQRKTKVTRPVISSEITSDKLRVRKLYKITESLIGKSTIPMGLVITRG